MATTTRRERVNLELAQQTRELAQHARDSKPDERPEQWGWHHEWGRAARLAGWIVAGLLLSMHATVQYGVAGRAWLTAFALTIIGALLRDVHRRKTAWRTHPRRE